MISMYTCIYVYMNDYFWVQFLCSEIDHSINERGHITLYELNNQIIVYLNKITNITKYLALLGINEW